MKKAKDDVRHVGYWALVKRPYETKFKKVGYLCGTRFEAEIYVSKTFPNLPYRIQGARFNATPVQLRKDA